MKITVTVDTQAKVPQKLQAYIEYNAADMKDSIKPLLAAVDEALEMMLVFVVTEPEKESVATTVNIE